MRSLKKIQTSLKSIPIILLAAGTLLVFINSILRYFFRSSLTWIDELSVILIVMVMFTMQPYLERHNKQLAIGILNSRLKNQTVKKALILLRAIITISFYLLLAVAGINVIKQNIALDSSTPVIGLPLYLIYTIVLMIMIIVILVWLLNLAQLFTARRDNNK